MTDLQQLPTDLPFDEDALFGLLVEGGYDLAALAGRLFDIASQKPDDVQRALVIQAFGPDFAGPIAGQPIAAKLLERAADQIAGRVRTRLHLATAYGEPGTFTEGNSMFRPDHGPGSDRIAATAYQRVLQQPHWHVQERWQFTHRPDLIRDAGAWPYELHVGDLHHHATHVQAMLRDAVADGVLCLNVNRTGVFVTAASTITGVFVELIDPDGNVVDDLETGYAMVDEYDDEYDDENLWTSESPGGRAVLGMLLATDGPVPLDALLKASLPGSPDPMPEPSIRGLLRDLVDRDFAAPVTDTEGTPLAYAATKNARLLAAGQLTWWDDASAAERALLGMLLDTPGLVPMDALLKVSGPTFSALSEKGVHGVLAGLANEDLAKPHWHDAPEHRVDRSALAGYSATDKARGLAATRPKED